MRATAEEALFDIRYRGHHVVKESHDHRQRCVFCGRTFEKHEKLVFFDSNLIPAASRPLYANRQWYACNECFEKVKP